MRQIHTLDRVGGTLAITPVRVGPGGPLGEYETTSYIFSWDSYAPGYSLDPADVAAAVAAEPEAEPEPDEEPEPEPEPAEPDEHEPEPEG